MRIVIFITEMRVNVSSKKSPPTKMLKFQRRFIKYFNQTLRFQHQLMLASIQTLPRTTNLLICYLLAFIDERNSILNMYHSFIINQ